MLEAELEEARSESKAIYAGVWLARQVGGRQGPGRGQPRGPEGAGRELRRTSICHAYPQPSRLSMDQAQGLKEPKEGLRDAGQEPSRMPNGMCFMDYRKHL